MQKNNNKNIALGFENLSSKDVVIPHSKKWFWQIWGQDRRAIAFHLQKTS